MIRFTCLRKTNREGITMNIALLGIDLAKNIFHLHAVDLSGKELFRKRLKRWELLPFIGNLQSTRIVIEACGGSNYWAREFEKLGHRVDVISAQYVKPFVKRNKNDYKDAEAICTAAMQANMRYVPKRSVVQQDIQNIHRVRERLIRARTALVNEMRGFLTEYGIVLPKGRKKFVAELLEVIASNEDSLSPLTRETLTELWQEYRAIESRIISYEKKLLLISKEDPRAKRLLSIPGVGLITATAMLAAIGDIHVFKNGRELAAWLGITPREYSTGGKQRLYGISKRGDKYLRKNLIHGARVTLNYLSKKTDSRSLWAKDLLERKGKNRAAVALANKNARTIWALLTREESYKDLPVAA